MVTAGAEAVVGSPSGALTFTNPGQLVGAGPANKATYVEPFILVDLFGTDPTGTSTTANDTAIEAAKATLPIRYLNGNLYSVGELWFGPNQAPTPAGGANSRGGYIISQPHNFGPFVTLRGAGEEATTLFCVDNGTAMTFLSMHTVDGFISDPDTANSGGIRDMTIDGRYSIGGSGIGNGITAMSTTGSPTTITTNTAHGFSTGQYVLIEGAPSAGLQSVCYGIWCVTVTGSTTFTIPANNVTSGAPSAIVGLLGPVGLDYGEMHGIHLKGVRFQHFASQFAVGLLEKSFTSAGFGGAGNEKHMDNQITLTNNTFGHYRTSVATSTAANATYTPGTATITDLQNGGGINALVCTHINGSTSPVTAGTVITSVAVNTGLTTITTGDGMRLSTGGANPTVMIFASNTTLTGGGTVSLVASVGEPSHIGSWWTYTCAKLNGGGTVGTVTTTAVGSSTTTIPVSSTASLNPGQTVVDQTSGFGTVHVTDVNPANLTILVSAAVSFGSGDTLQFTASSGDGGGSGQTLLQFDAGVAGSIAVDNGKFVVVGNASLGASGNATIIGINTGSNTGGVAIQSSFYGTDLTIDMLASGGWGSNMPMAVYCTGTFPAYWNGNAEINLQPKGANAWAASTGMANTGGTVGTSGLAVCWSGQVVGDSNLNSKLTATLGANVNPVPTSATSELTLVVPPGQWRIRGKALYKGGSSAQNMETWIAGPGGQNLYSGTTALDLQECQPPTNAYTPVTVETYQQIPAQPGNTNPCNTFYLNVQASTTTTCVLFASSSINSYPKVTQLSATPV